MNSPAVSAVVCIWRSCCKLAATCCCSTNRPTTLDIETLRALENALLEFPGCAMVISHDRWFLDRIATHILDYRDEGKVEFFEGNFTEYEEYKKRTLGADALEPKRIKYKRIAK